jgi:hypothetical protein
MLAHLGTNEETLRRTAKVLTGSSFGEIVSLPTIDQMLVAALEQLIGQPEGYIGQNVGADR